MLQKVWNLLHPEAPKTIDEIVDIILKNRNISDKTALLNPSLNHINYQVNNIELVNKRIEAAIQQKEKIIVFGDYDVDGLCASTIMWETLHTLGAQVLPYIPHREQEGYGLSAKALENVIAKHQPKLIVTVDCGISSKNEIASARSQGIDIIVTDHHNPPSELPDCLIIHDHHVCGATVAWKLSQHLLSQQQHILSPPTDHLALAALGTICDIIPLSLENRSIVTHGLEIFRTTQRPGIRALCQTAGIEQSQIQTYHFGYIIGPRLNAQGRLDHAMQALRLLCTNDFNRAVELSSSLQDINKDRQELTREISEQATQLAKQHLNEHILIIGDPSWNPGIIGLIASHLVKEFHKPSIVWGSSDEHPNILKASARSINGFHITENIRLFKDHLLGYGGHPMAAGLSLSAENLDNFAQELRNHAKETISTDQLIPKITLDTELSSSFISPEVYYTLQRLGPFGADYNEPMFRLSSMRVINAKAIGKNNTHLKLTVADQNQKQYDALFWNQGQRVNTLTSHLDIAAKLDLNTYNGTTKAQLNIVDLQESK